MAAFMNRLGTALTPAQLPVDVAPGAIDLDAEPGGVPDAGLRGRRTFRAAPMST